MGRFVAVQRIGSYAATKRYDRVVFQLQNCSLARVTQGDCSLKTKEKTERQCGQ
jgi:hypothetical protein